jgi:hypothetical protein
MRRFFAALVLLALSTSSVAAELGRPMKVSLVQLLATPERFDGKEVQVAGFVQLEFESTVLYLHREDHGAQLLQNSLWLSQDSPEVAARHDQLNLNYVELVATFHSKRKGHMGLFPGTLSGIRWIERVPGT